MSNLNDGMQLVLAFFVFAFYMISYFSLGSLVGGRTKKVSLSHTLIVGFFLYFVLFECIALPMKIMCRPLSQLGYIWMSVMIVIIGAAIWKQYMLRKKHQGFFVHHKVDKKFYIAFILLILFEFFVLVTITAVEMGVRDDAYYIADVTTSVFTDTIQQYNHITGQKYQQFVGNYFIPMYPVQSAVICKLTGLHPLVENKWSSVLAILIISNLIYYKLFQVLFKKKDNKKIIVALAIMFFINSNIVFFGRETGTFFMYRLTEGKGVLGNVILPGIVYAFSRIINNEKKIGRWGLLIITIFSGYAISMSSMFIVPVCVSGLFVGFLLVKKKFQYIVPMFFCMLPCLLIIGAYGLMQKGILVFPVK